MKTWLKENWFHFGILLVIAFGIATYSFYLIQKSSLEEQKFTTQTLENSQKQVQTDLQQKQQTQLLEDANSLKESEIARKKITDEKRADCLNIEETFNNARMKTNGQVYTGCLDIYSTAVFITSDYRESEMDKCTVENAIRVEQTANQHKANMDYCIATYNSN